jgi:leucine dehydrogenase
VSRALGGSGDPSEATAYGVFHAMKAVARRLWNTTSLEGRHVVVSGVGKVGHALVRHLVEERSQVTVADVNAAAVEKAVADFAVEAVPPEKAHAVECDVFSPCAMGGALNATTVPELRCAAVVGSANNQLQDPSCGDQLAAAGIVYAPDYIVNAGGVINIAEELSIGGYHRERAYAAVRRIFDTTAAVLETAERESITTATAADRLAERRIADVAHVRLIRTFAEGGPR